MGVVAALTEARAQLGPRGSDHDCLGLAKLDPRLVLTYQPSRCRLPPPVDGLGEVIASVRRQLAAAWAGQAVGDGSEGPEGPDSEGLAQPAPLGLSEVRNPQNRPSRYGTKGLSKAGARQIQRACGVLQDDLGCLSFWTVTLPDSTIRELVTRDLWPRFQTRIRDLLVRALVARGLPPRVVGVVELHPARSMRERLPLPHLHVIFHGSRRRWRGWALGPADLDRIIRDAVRYAGLPAPDVSSAGNVQPVRRNAGAYLSKYMTKNTQAGWLAQVPGNLPRVWWFWSGCLRAQVLALVVEVCWAFVSMLHRASPSELERIGAVRVQLELADARAPSCWLVRFRGAAAIRRAAKLFERLAERDMVGQFSI